MRGGRRAEGGAAKLWAGLLPRGARIVVATIVLTKIKDGVTERYSATATAAA